MHIVSWNQKYMNADDAAKYTDGLAVLSILFRLSTRDNPVLEPVIQVLPEVRDPDDHTLITIPATSIKHFLPKFPDRYFRYHGSLTTPNCNQAVIWSVFEQPQFISERQLNYFRQMLASSTHLETKLQRQLDLATNGRVFSRRIRLIDNFRPIYELHGRHVYRSFKHFDVKPSLSKYYKEQSCFKPFDFKSGSKSYPLKPPNYLPILSKY
ncbi:carbonic anhydrase 14-like [Ruditapes philippinarum]|uniref:carbonic anhydrase 14-like n=1 Tax=Ruditapes philippinarum TaxID=129788 RepID=UPI00295B6B9D|nr:carbonic anhydrase 14-like [Ruditapes philippinarum]